MQTCFLQFCEAHALLEVRPPCLPPLFLGFLSLVNCAPPRAFPDVFSALRVYVCTTRVCAQAAIKEEGLDFVRTDRYGYLTADPRNIGSALKATVLLKLPLLGVHKEYRRPVVDIG